MKRGPLQYWTQPVVLINMLALFLRIKLGQKYIHGLHRILGNFITLLLPSHLHVCVLQSKLTQLSN